MRLTLTLRSGRPLGSGLASTRLSADDKESVESVVLTNALTGGLNGSIISGMGARGSVLRMIVVTSSVLLLGACSVGPGNVGGTAQSQAPPPISVEEYGTTLAGALEPLDSALKGLAKAKAYRGLNDRVAAVETAADQAVTELSPITPPAELAAVSYTHLTLPTTPYV